MKIAEKIIEQQNTKEMTRKAILTLKSLGENVEDLENEFLITYNEPVTPLPHNARTT